MSKSYSPQILKLYIFFCRNFIRWWNQITCIVVSICQVKTEGTAMIPPSRLRIIWYKTVDSSSILSLYCSQIQGYLIPLVHARSLCQALLFTAFASDSPLHTILLIAVSGHDCLNKPKLTCSEILLNVCQVRGWIIWLWGIPGAHCYKQYRNLEMWGWSTRKMI